METGVSRASLDQEPEHRFVRLRQQLGVGSFGINLLVFEPGQRSRIHRHERQEEVYLVLEGTLSLLVEGQESELTEGELVRVAPDVRRQLVNRGPGRLRVLALGGAAEHEGRDGHAYRSWDDEEGGSPRDIPFPEDLPADERRGG